MKYLVILALLVVGGCSSTSLNEVSELGVEYSAPDIQTAPYYFANPVSESLDFEGQLLASSGEDASGSMLYPGYNAGGFLAAILVHAAVNSSVESGQEKKRIDNANLVLRDHLNDIQALSHSELQQYVIENREELGLARMPESIDGGAWYVRADPVFTLSASQDAISVSNSIVISDKAHLDDEADAEIGYRRVVDVSTIGFGEIYDGFLLADDSSEYFRTSVIHVFAQSIGLAIRDFKGELPEADAVSTVRYLDNGEKRVERGKILNESCGRVLFESLRGELRLLPSYEPSVREPCHIYMQGL